jgi:hypothetical protein
MLEREKDEAMRSAISGLLTSEENTTGWKADLVLTDNRFCD